MANAIDRLSAEHANLGRLVRLLDGRSAVGAELTSVTVALFVDVMYYLTHFPDVSHHPAEDGIVERLRGKGALPPGFGDEIEAQHATLERQGVDLMRDLESAAREESMSWELVEANIRLYAERLRHNMAVEELILFPAALRHFEADDWLAIDAITARVQHDPLLSTSTEDRFAQLRRVIAAEADCGCEQEPAPGGLTRPGA